MHIGTQNSKLSKSHWILYLKMGEFYGIKLYFNKVILKNKVIESHPQINPPCPKKKEWLNHNGVLDLLSMDRSVKEMKTILSQSAENLFSPLTDPQLRVNLEAEDTSLNSKGIKNDHKHPLHSRKASTLSKRKAKFPF